MKQQNHKKRIRMTPARLMGLLLTALIVCCILLSFFETPLGLQVDLTQDKVYTLTPETEELLKDLDDAVTIYTLYSPGNYNKIMMTLLEKYVISSNKITVSNIDPTSDRVALKEFEKIDEVNDGSLVIADETSGRFRVVDVGELYQENQEEIYFFAENSITSAIHYVVTGEFQRIYMMTGHRETAISELESFLGRYRLLNFRIEEYDYLRTAGAPVPHTDILLSVSPKEDFSETETASIMEFIRQGGTFILLYDNAVYNEELGIIEVRENEMPNLREMLSIMGITIEDGLITGKNVKETGFRDTSVELEQTQSGMQYVFSECTALKSRNTKNCVTNTLLQTLPDCILRKSNGEAEENGPFIVGMTSTLEQGTLAVFSTSSFVRDTEFKAMNNEQLLDGLLYDALPGKPKVALDAKKMNTDQLFINSVFMKTIITLVVLLVIPGAILGAGIYILRKRKEKSA